MIFPNINIFNPTLNISYQEGFDKGQQEGNSEAYHLGYHRGAEIGAELGFYLGVLESLVTTNEKVVGLINKAKEAIEKFPKTNDENVDLFGDLGNIRTQFKKITSILKVKVQFNEKEQLTF